MDYKIIVDSCGELTHKMKESGIEWIGEIPEGWEVRKIKTFSPVLRGASPRPIDDPQYFDESGKYSWVRISDVSAAKKYLYSAGDRLSKIGESKSAKIHAGDLFVSICASVGKACISKIDCCIHDGFVYFPSLDRRMVNFLYYIFTSGECYSGLGKLGTQLNLNTNTVADIYIPFSSIEHCAYIADYLDAKCARIDESAALVRQSMEKLRAYKLSLITEAVTKGLDPNVPMKDSGIPWIGETPKGWIICTLASCVVSIESGVSVNAGGEPAKENEFGILKTSCVYGFSFNVLENKSVNHDEYCRLKCSVKKDSLIVSRMNTPELVGACGYVDESYENIFLPDRLWQVSIKKSYCSKFIYYYIVSSPVRAYLASRATGTSGSMKNISQKQFVTTPFVCPPLAEQQRIADYLDAKCARIDALLEEKERLLNRLAEYKKSLIFECVTGKREVSA